MHHMPAGIVVQFYPMHEVVNPAAVNRLVQVGFPESQPVPGAAAELAGTIETGQIIRRKLPQGVVEPLPVVADKNDASGVGYHQDFIRAGSQFTLDKLD